MNRFVEWIVGTVVSAVVASDVRSADPVVAARKRAARGMFVSLVATWRQASQMLPWWHALPACTSWFDTSSW
ncbi:hypothetical protein JAO10_31315 [Burkholderia contaminans]|uniref:hypothetical protein n=1 Tax=Burkholderia cepacia complex TaxID=87882 RepID=UPI0010415E7B|nr:MULTISPECIES: hypothetical protein [Burkholderia cepacia complex]MBH9724824.1 hypothetical protein [Burkholderia contaminans]MBR8094183.1 hypothetical protein [Burkholderia cenocepacia]MBY4710667.1 hypothetical protein [Burkholderia cepacia]MBY4737151.1 hypothetical protein [Burkholderia cepacia]MBY4744489.1 hypothetical protein [Burkholderia cepacia]